MSDTFTDDMANVFTTCDKRSLHTNIIRKRCIGVYKPMLTTPTLTLIYWECPQCGTQYKRIKNIKMAFKKYTGANKFTYPATVWTIIGEPKYVSAG